MPQALPVLMQRLSGLPWVARHAMAVALFLLALLARFVLHDVLPAGFPFLTFFPAVLLTAFLFGLWPGLLAAALSILAAWYYFIPPSGSFAMKTVGDTVAVVFFSAILAVDCIVIHIMNQALGRLRGTEQQLRSSAQRLRLVLDNLFVNVLILDRDGTVREANRAPLLVHPEGDSVRPGSTHSERATALVGSAFHDLPWFAGQPALQTQMRLAVERASKGDTQRYDLTIRGVAAGAITLDTQIAPLREDDGSVSGIVVCGVDVSQRIDALADVERSKAQAQAAAAAADAERRVLDATFNTVPAGIILADAQGKLLRMNRATAQIWGQHTPPTDSVDGYGEWKGWWADRSPRHGQRLQAHEWGLARSLRGETCIDVVEIEPFDMPGERRVTLLSSAPVVDSDGKVQGGVVAQVDITGRMRAEDALRESEAKFRAVADNMPQLAWMCDELGHLYWYNKRWYEYTGLNPDGSDDHPWRVVHHPDEIDRVAAKFHEHIQSGEPWQDTFPMRRHDGEYRWFLSRALPVRDEDGRVTRWFGTNTDITEQLQIERALRDSEDRLLAREAALREADHQKDTFLATLGHELRNPLSPIRSAAHVIRVSGTSDPKVLQMAAVIERQTAQLKRLVDDLLDVSRISFGQVQLQRRPMNLRRAIDIALETCRPLIQEGHIAFSLHVPEQPLMVDADETRVAQAVSNVLNNAFKFTPAGGSVQLHVEARDGGQAAVTVRDSGQGVAQDMLDKVFELFAQEKRSGMGGSSGLGIGLALARRLVDMHGGRISVKSAGPGQGAEFEILLPLLGQPLPGEPVPRASAASRGAKVLVVDDNPDTVDTMGALLQLLGHTVFTAVDGASALVAARAHHPGVVLLDIGLPDMSGYEVARRIRDDPSMPPGMLLVALTGWGQDDDRERAQRAGFDKHMTKPAEPAGLEALLHAHLHGQQEGRTQPAQA